MSDRKLDPAVRSLLGELGERALPSPSFTEVEVPVVSIDVTAPSPFRRAMVPALALSAVALLLVIGFEISRNSAPPATESGGRWVAIPLVVPARAALVSIGQSDDASRLQYRSGSGTVSVQSWPETTDPVVGAPTGELLWGAPFWEQSANGTMLTWQSPGGGTVVLTVDGYDGAQALRIANSMYYATPAVAEQLTAKFGFASPDDEARIHDGWSPPGAPRSQEVGLLRSLQSKLNFGARHRGGMSGIDPAPAACAALPLDQQDARWDVLVSGPSGVEVIEIEDEVGWTRVEVASPPGAPQLVVGIANVGAGASESGFFPQCRVVVP